MTNGEIIFDMIHDGTSPRTISLLIKAGHYSVQDWDDGIAIAVAYDNMEKQWRESLSTAPERAAQFIADGVSPELAISARHEFIRQHFIDSIKSGKEDPEARARYQALFSNEISEADIKRAATFPLDRLISCKNGMARCPLHNEKTASLHITNNLYYCFGCGVKGNTIHFVRATRGLGFVDAVRYINSL